MTMAGHSSLKTGWKDGRGRLIEYQSGIARYIRAQGIIAVIEMARTVSIDMLPLAGVEGCLGG